MHFFKCDDLQAWTGGKWFGLNAGKKPEILGFSIDSRAMEKNFAFVAIKAERDGAEFAADAVKNGASAIIAERELDVDAPVLVVPNALKAFQRIAKMHRLRFDNPVIGVTGSCGKTSTKEMLAKLISWKNPLFTEKNFNNALGVPLTLTRIDTRQNQAAIIEAGVSGIGEMQELAEMIEPDLAIITNVGIAHLEKFKEIANVAKEKAVLCTMVAKEGWALFHHNLLSWKVFDELSCKRAILAPMDAPEIKADLVFRYAIKDNGENLSVEMSIEGGSDYYFELEKMSDGMIDDALLCAAAALMLGTKEEQLASKISQLKPLAMRGATITLGEVDYRVDCYNASPTSMKDALAFFKKSEAEKSPKLYVLGTMAELGLATLRHHKDIGFNLPHSDGDHAILIGDKAELYKDGMLESGNWTPEEISIYSTAEEAAEQIAKFEKGAVFVKGSRVCELEKALPQVVLDLAHNIVSNEQEEEEIEEAPSPTPSSKNDEDDFQEEDFDEEEIDDEDDITDESEDERF